MKGWEGVSRTAATFNFSFKKKFYRGGILPRGDFSREIVGTLPKHSCKPSLDLKEPVISVQRLAQSIIKCTHRHRLTSCYYYINPTNLITPFRVIIKHCIKCRFWTLWAFLSYSNVDWKKTIFYVYKILEIKEWNSTKIW